MINSKKKGFTIVELVIVVAVIAILAAVLIPTFSNLVKKANLNADQQAVANMNKFTAMGVVDGEYEYASDALKSLYAAGFNQGKLVTYSSDYHYAYNFEKNQFFLLDDTDNAIYPHDQVDESKLWGFYNNSKGDKIEGVTKYIALSPIYNTVPFYDQADSVFYGTSNFILDLNNNYIGIEGRSNITIINGQAVENSGFNYNEDEIETREVVDKTNGETPRDYATVSNSVYLLENIVYNNDGAGMQGAWSNIDAFENATSVVFKNCTFINARDIQVGNINNNVTSYLFDNCTFINNSDNAVLYIHGSDINFPDVTITNCYFSTGRGITLGVNGVESAVGVYGNIVIENNTFNISNNTKPMIQFSASKDKVDTDVVPTSQGIFKCSSLVVKNNNFVSGSTAIRIHDTVVEMQCGSVTFSNNKIGEKIPTVIGDGTTESENIAEELAKKFN